jgi:hypothetical protein
MCFGLRRQRLICGCRRTILDSWILDADAGHLELPRNGFLLTGGRPCRQILDNGFKYRNVVACGSLPLYTLTFIHE